LNYRGSGKDKILKLQKDTYGYSKVILYKNGKAKTKQISLKYLADVRTVTILITITPIELIAKNIVTVGAIA
jgi:hypothetical protein